MEQELFLRVAELKANLRNWSFDSCGNYRLTKEDAEAVLELEKELKEWFKLKEEIDVCLERYEDKRSSANSMIVQAKKNKSPIIESYYQGVVDAFSHAISDLGRWSK